MGRHRFWVAVVLVAMLGDACSSSWHRSVKPDTAHDDVTGYARYLMSISGLQDVYTGVSNGYPTYKDKAYPPVKDVRGALADIDCRQPQLRQSITRGLRNPEAGPLSEQLPVYYFRGGRSAVADALNNLDSVDGRDAAWRVLQRFGA